MSLTARGRFISLEGGEGVGKSTQSRALAAALRARGIEVVETREPGGSTGAEAIRKLLLEGGADRWGARAEALLFAAARADHVDKTILPALEAGRWVICDRFLDSSIAYQGGADGLGPRRSAHCMRSAVRVCCPIVLCCSKWTRTKRHFANLNETAAIWTALESVAALITIEL